MEKVPAALASTLSGGEPPNHPGMAARTILKRRSPHRTVCSHENNAAARLKRGTTKLLYAQCQDGAETLSGRATAAMKAGGLRGASQRPHTIRT